jgi:DNA-directed RNA polymerase subunit RPC12/RpoP
VTQFRCVSDGLGSVDVVVIVWSENASSSKWVNSELATALARSLSESDSLRIVPAVLDDTPLPALLAPLVWLDLRDEDVPLAVRRLMGFKGDNERLKAIQQTLEESGLEYRDFPGYGVLVACPRCGATVNNLEQWNATDFDRDDDYAGARCRTCGWEDGGEV